MVIESITIINMKKKLMGRMVQAVLRIPVEIDAEVQAIAKKQCRSYSSVMRQAIVEWLETAKEGRNESQRYLYKREK